MSTIHAAEALTAKGWCRDVRLTIDRGRIAKIEAGVAPDSGDERHAIVLPGMPNLHSHAFQRGMAGLAERRGPGADSFWSWRDVMYRFALTMSPEQVEAVACQAYVEMLETGFSRVGEFHYLHHDCDGRPYGNIAEMAERIAAAAESTSIGLTLLPVFYAHSNFGGAPPTESQRRFVNDLSSFARLLDACRAAVRNLAGAVTGVAPHSLRAVTPAELTAVAGMALDGPRHIHIAEQVKEVDDCLAWSGQRPVAWLLENAAVDSSWCLVHATHMTQAETTRLANSGAVAGLCPVTEANLGDGIFNARDFAAANGRFGVGSDSNVQIGVADELRLLEYSQRLANRARNVLASDGQSTGRYLFDSAVRGGSIALGVKSDGIAEGGAADFISLDSRHVALAGRSGDDILDAWVFTSGSSLVDCVWVGGAKLVEAGRHKGRDAIATRFLSVLRSLQQT